MKFAYVILAHDRPEQLKELINQLDDGNNFFFVYIDSKVNIIPFIKQNYINSSSIFFCKDRINISWGGFSQIKATLSLLKGIVESNISIDYIHFLSGKDFPIKTNEYINQFFELNKGYNFMDFFPLPYSGWDGNNGMDRIRYKWDIDEVGYDISKQNVEKQKRHKEIRDFPFPYSPYGGSQWWSFTKECIEFIIKTCITENKLYRFYENTFIPDEMFFQTLLMNSDFKSSIINNNLRYIDWNTGPEYPHILTIKDFDKLKASNKLYARKFDNKVDNKIMHLLHK